MYSAQHFSFSWGKTGCPSSTQIRKWSLLDKGKDFFFVGHERAAELFLPHLSAPPLSKLMPRVVSLQGRKKLLSTSSSWLTKKAFHEASGWESNEQGLVGKNSTYGERATKMLSVVLCCLGAFLLSQMPAVGSCRFVKSEMMSISNLFQSYLKVKQAGKQKMPLQRRWFEQHVTFASLSRWWWCVQWLHVL